MGSGKSTIGRILSERLGYSFLDTDHLIEKNTGLTIPEIFSSGGEDEFRRLESIALRDALGRDNVIISCGGGIILREENRTELKTRAFVVYLRVTPQEAFTRVGKSGHKRPLLKVEDPQAQISRLMREREPLYLEVADIVIDTTGQEKSAVADRIVKEMKDKGYLK